MDDIYRDELMDIYKDPAHRGSMEEPSVEMEKKNPLCGDVINIQLAVADGKLADIKFDGAACAVSVISAELLAEELIGKTIKEAKNMTKDDLLDLLDLDLTTSRVKCATLILDALHGALEIYE